ncbi:MAG: Type secretion system protein, partial [Patescibacteria group bacterium]|nr:Type secretion system protein [Patescibacteria group bacterium]
GQYYQCPSPGWGSLSTDPELPSYPNCSTSGSESSVAFYSTLSGSDVPVEYSFVPGGTDNGIETPGYIAKKTTSAGTPIELTSTTDVDIKSMKLYVNNPAPGAGQPSIFLIITGEAKILDNQVTQFGLQTLVSQRVLNLP